jgi:murein DD-endopeptidase MepM/ murein hydrolase activator NlpD
MRWLRTGLLGGPPVPTGCIVLAVLVLLALLGCGVIGFVSTAASLSGIGYWAAQTSTPVPTVTVFLGTTTPVYADTPVPGLITATPEWVLTTGTPPWVTTTPMYVTETPPPPATTTPSLPMIGFTTPEPTETPYYRVGTFYMNSDVYIGGPHGGPEGCPQCLVFRITGHETQDSPNDAGATYHFITVRVTNYGSAETVVPASDLFFIRHVEQGGEVVVGRWTAQNEPLIARGLPSYDAQQLDTLAAGQARDYVIAFVVPDGEVGELGLITNWIMPLEGGLPVWFYLENDPLGPFVDAHQPPPPTPIVLDEGGSYGGGAIGTPGPVVGRWPTTGTVTRGFGCHEYYTGIDGAGWGCPDEEPWFHNGVDIANATGTAIVSPVDGTMQYAGPNSAGPDCSHIPGSEAPHEGLGNYQRVSGGGTLQYFGHLSSFAVTSGNVTAGQTISGMGSTGCSTGPHLHWIVYQGGNLVDPAVWAGPGP